MAGRVSDAVIRRLPGYYRHLRELERAGVKQISSQELGEQMNLTPSQIRQDINCFGGFGRQGYGYSVSELKGHIAEILGMDQKHRMIIIGAGSIGSAVARYPSFAKMGFETEALFDSNPALVGTDIENHPILGVDELEEYLAGHDIDIVVLAIPVTGAQAMVDRLYRAGVRSVWNFAPKDLKHPADMIIVNVHLTDTLAILSYKMKHREALGDENE